MASLLPGEPAPLTVRQSTAVANFAER